MGDNTTKQTNQNTSQTASQATPYSQTQKLYDTAFGDALNNYQKTAGAADWGKYSSMGRDRIMDTFNMTGADGFTTQQRGAVDALMPTMRGHYLDISNAPGYEQIRNRIQADAATEAAMTASMRGRGGSPYAQGHVASEVADALAGFDLSQYNTERDRQNAAAAQIFGMGQTGLGNAGSSAYDLISLGQTPNIELERLLGVAGAGLPFAKTQTDASGSGSGATTQPRNTLGMIGGGLLGGASLLFG